MPNSSDSDEFYDAEEDVKCEGSRKNRKASRDSLTKRSNSVPNVSTADTIEEEKVDQKIPAETVSDSVFVEPSKIRPIGGRKRFQEIREKLQNEDEDWVASNITPPNSQNSSIEGVYVGTSKKTPFRVVEPDTVSLQSINSLGRVGRIFNNVPEPPTNFPVHPDKTRKAISVSALSLSSQESTSTPSSNSKDTSLFPSTTTLSPDQLVTDKKDSKNEIPAILPLQEPDVIASTKASSIQKSYAPFNHSPLKEAPPVAPPRRKKKNLTHSKSSSISSATFETCDLASPVSTIESLTKEFENCLERPPSIKSIKSDKVRGSDNDSKSSTLKSGHSLDIRQAIKGQFVVKPQDIDNLKAESSSSYVDSGNVGIDLQGINTLQVCPEPTSPRISQGRGSVGHYSLGPHRGTNKTPTQSSKERRKSAGDESLLRASALRVRTHTDSGKHLSDYEILEQITVLNLDTGEKMPLSLAEDKLPQCINPLSLHIMRLTSEYVSSNSMDKEKESDEESVDTKKSEACSEEFTDNAMGKVRKKTAKFKRFVDTTVKKTMNKARTIAQEVTHARHKEDTIDIVDMVNPGEHNIKLKTSSSHKGPYEFEKVEHVQEIKDEHEGPIWCMKFSGCGRLLATAGQDKILRIWIVRDAFTFFQEMRTKYNAEKASPTPSQESLVSHHSTDTSNMSIFESMANKDNKKLVFMPKPFCTYSGHTSDLLDVSWSKNYFILSSSMDKTVRLWHISRKECLCCFQHIDFVTAIAFHPRDDRYFLSGSLDGKLRLWNIPDKKVAVWSEVDGSTKLITAANFCLNGIFAVIGTYDGRCIFYNTDQLKYHTTINVRSTRGRNATGRKICGIEPMPGEDKVLVTSNDSRIRLYNLKDLNVSCKYKGYVNMSSHIKGSFSHDGKYIVSGSENRDIYIWKTYHDYAKFSSVRRDRNDFWEAIKAHNAVVTCAIFAPNSEGIIKMVEEQTKGDDMDDNNRVEDPIVEQHTKSYSGYVLVSADFNGCIKVFINKMKPKHSSLPVSAMS